MPSTPDKAIYQPFPTVSGRPFHRENLGSKRRPDQYEADMLACQELLAGHFGEHINPLPGETRDEARRRVGQVPINLYKPWLRAYASTYSSPPFRTFSRKGVEVPEAVADLVNDVYVEAGVDAVLAECDLQQAMTGNVALAVGWSAARDCVLLSLWAGGAFRVVTELDPAAPELIVCRVSDDLNLVWQRQLDGGFKYQFVAAGKEPGAAWQDPDIPNPLVFFSESAQTNATGFNGRGIGIEMGGVSIALMCDGYNALGNIVITQGHSILEMHGTPLTTTAPNGQDAVVIGPTKPLQFAADSDQEQNGAKYLTPSPAISETVETLGFLKREAQQSYGLPATLWDVADDASGAQTTESRAPLVEHRVRRSQLFRVPENMLLRAVLGVAVLRGRLLAADVGDISEWSVDVGFVDPMTEEELEEDTDGDGNGSGSGSDDSGSDAPGSGEPVNGRASEE